MYRVQINNKEFYYYYLQNSVNTLPFSLTPVPPSIPPHRSSGNLSGPLPVNAEGKAITS